jgi:hypothetical protein
MISGSRRVKLTIPAVLFKISPYDIFKFYMPGVWHLNQVTLSPFPRGGGGTESTPSFIIGNKKGSLTFIDFASGDNGDAFEFVKVLFNLSTIDDVLRKIDSDFALGFITGMPTTYYKRIVSEYKQPEDLGKRYSLIQVMTRKFTHEELEYWNGFYQDISDLRREHIYSIKSLYLNKSKFLVKDNELRFAYLFEGGYWKIYSPHQEKKKKWLSNVPLDMLDEKKDIKVCDTLFITKSKKDKMVLQKVYPYVVATQNESIAPYSQENVDYIKKNSKRQILMYDSDIPGITSSQKITELFGFDYCNVPRIYLQEGIKDFAELGRRYGLELILDILKLKGIYNCPERL